MLDFQRMSVLSTYYPFNYPWRLWECFKPLLKLLQTLLLTWLANSFQIDSQQAGTMMLLSRTSMVIRVPRRDLIVTKLNGAKIATAQTCWLDHRKLLLQGFRCTCNPLCGIWLRSSLYEFMLWNQPFVVTSLQKGEVVIPGANSVQGPCQWPNRPARVKKSDPGLYLWLGWMGA